MTARLRGSGQVCAELEALGVRTVFTLPGTQNISLLEALRRSRLRTVVPASELAGGFMANGYARISGRPGVLLTIPGPGFAYALPALAEARLDSVPIVHLTGTPAESPGSSFQLQAIDQAAIAAPLVKGTVRADRPHEISPVLRRAFALARGGEPGPVLVELSPSALAGVAPPGQTASGQGEPTADPELVARLAGELTRATRVLIYAGQGAAAAPDLLRELAERLPAPVVATTSARGVLPEDHPLVLPYDPVGGGIDELNALIESCDLVLALGCKLGHNGAAGFKLRLPREKLVHVDASPEVLGRNYPARVSAAGDVPELLAALLEANPRHGSAWIADDIARAAASLRRSRAGQGPESTLPELVPNRFDAFFRALRRALPRTACLVTDSGLHQYLARRHFDVLEPRGLIVPTDFQAMGFGLPAAVGAALAAPDRHVVALIGDGGLAVSPSELATAAREGVRLSVIVLTDGRYGLIRLQQLAGVGQEFGIDLPATTLRDLARAYHVGHARLEGPVDAALAEVLDRPGVTVAEVRVEAEGPARASRRKGAVKARRDRALAHLPFGIGER